MPGTAVYGIFWGGCLRQVTENGMLENSGTAVYDIFCCGSFFLTNNQENGMFEIIEAVIAAPVGSA